MCKWRCQEGKVPFLQLSVPHVYTTTPPSQSDNVLQPYCNRIRTELNREKSVLR